MHSVSTYKYPIPKDLVFLKLGGSLITDKTKTASALENVIQRLAHEIAAALSQKPDIKLLIGHGSGSFGHHSASKYNTRAGVKTEHQWHGFAEVWNQASTLNRIVASALHTANLPAVVFPPSALTMTKEGKILTWDLQPMLAAFQAGLIPVVYGDVAFDYELGGTIISTENIFGYLAEKLSPQRILIAGIEPGVWADYPECSKIIPEISHDNFSLVTPSIHSSAATDVTGGMATKVSEMLALTQKIPGLTIQIFSGNDQGMIKASILGGNFGTKLVA